jgi:hypothetical protein
MCVPETSRVRSEKVIKRLFRYFFRHRIVEYDGVLHTVVAPRQVKSGAKKVLSSPRYFSPYTKAKRSPAQLRVANLDSV